MSNMWMPKAIEAAHNGGLGLPAATIKFVAVDTGAYTFSAAHEFLSDVPGGARIATSAALTKTLGIVSTKNYRFNVDDFSLTFAASQPTIEGGYYYIDTGSAATSRLLKWMDNSPSIPLTPPPGGGTVPVTVPASGVWEVQNP